MDDQARWGATGSLVTRGVTLACRDVRCQEKTIVPSRTDRPRHRYRLYCLLMGVFVAASATLVYGWLELAAQRRETVVRLVRRLSGSVESQHHGPSWLPRRYREHISLVRVPDPFGPVDYVDDPFRVNNTSHAADEPDPGRAVEGDFDRLLSELKHIRSLQALDLRLDDLRDAHLRLLKDFRGLCDLRISRFTFTSRSMRHVGRLSGLNSLDLSYCDLSDSTLQHLAGLTRLRQLQLRRTSITDEGLRHLAGLTNLVELNLGMTRVGGPGLSRLSGLRRLERLRLEKGPYGFPESGEACCAADMSIPDESFQLDLRRLPRLPRLRMLDLTCANFTPPDLDSLTRLTELESLVLRRSNIDDRTLPTLAKITTLQWLDLSDTVIAGSGLTPLLELPNLRTLYIAHTLSDHDLTVAGKMLPLRSLTLDGATAVGEGRLSQLKGLVNLEYLALINFDLADIDQLELEGVSQLKTLCLAGNVIPQEVAAQLKKKLPHTEITSIGGQY